MPKLENRHAVVTGASSGIGAALCRVLGERGCRVTLAARRTDLLEQVAAEVRASGGQALAVPTDVTQRDSVFALAETAAAQFGTVDVWVSNAGGGILHDLLEATDEDMFWQYRLNCLSAMWAWQAVIPAMLEHGEGTVVDVCSLGGKAGFAYGGGYVAAKSALSALGDSMRQQLLGTNVNVLTVYAGLTETEFSDVRPDRSEGGLIGDGARLRNSGSLLGRTVLAHQTPRYVATAIIRAIERRSPVVYPHKWGTLACLAMNLWPRLALSIMGKLRKQTQV